MQVTITSLSGWKYVHKKKLFYEILMKRKNNIFCECRQNIVQAQAAVKFPQPIIKG